MNYLLRQTSLKAEFLIGENVLEFWAHSKAYSFDIWDYDENGIRTYLKSHSPKMKIPHALFTRRQLREFRRLNKTVKRNPQLCDWVAYQVLKDPV